MKRLRLYLMVDAYAFTFVTLFNAVITQYEEKKLFLDEVIPIFIATTVIAALMCLTDTLCKERNLIFQLLRLLDIVVPILLIQAFRNDLQINSVQVLVYIIFALISYGVVHGLMYISWQQRDQKINERLKKLHAKKNEKDK